MLAKQCSAYHVINTRKLWQIGPKFTDAISEHVFLYFVSNSTGSYLSVQLVRLKSVSCCLATKVIYYNFNAGECSNVINLVLFDQMICKNIQYILIQPSCYRSSCSSNVSWMGIHWFLNILVVVHKRRIWTGVRGLRLHYVMTRFTDTYMSHKASMH